MPLNIEIKARCNQPEQVRSILLELGADYRGLDHQIDSYFTIPDGRLKLRQGNIENSLIFYNRPNEEGPKPSEVELYHTSDGQALHQVLSAALPTYVVVDKNREIYFIHNVKFHIDQVKGLGSFVEIEAIDRDGSIGAKKLEEQCNHYLAVLKIEEADLLSSSYSDMLLNNS